MKERTYKKLCLNKEVLFQQAENSLVFQKGCHVLDRGSCSLNLLNLLVWSVFHFRKNKDAVHLNREQNISFSIFYFCDLLIIRERERERENRLFI